MTREDLLAHCLAKPGAWLDQPWDTDVVVKVASKVFVFTGAAGEPVSSIGVKCGRSREEAEEWLQRFPDDARVMAYIGRFGWNTLSVGGKIEDDEILEAIDVSYEMVLSKLPKKDRPDSGAAG